MQANLFGQFLLEHGTIDSDQLKQALDYQRAHNRVLGELAVEMGLLDEEGISRIIEHQRHVDKDFGGVAVKLGLMSEDNLDELLREQQRSHLRLGDVLVRFRRVLVPEMNMGQLARLIRSEFLIETVSLNKVKGKPFTSSEIEAKVLEVMKETKDVG